MAGNQLGKTLAGGFECAMHLTGRYPNWWKGRKFDRAVRFWVASVTGESTRDNAQRILVGPPAVREAWGTGTIPADAIEQVSLSRNLANAVDSIVVRHRSGNLSMLKFKAYGMGREKWQGETLDGVWFDEEPHLDRLDRSLHEMRIVPPMGRAALRLVLREVLPADLVEPEPEQPVAEAAAAPAKPAVYVGGVLIDEDDEDEDESADQAKDPEFYGVIAEGEPELPGLTDEALRLLEVAREELAA